MARKKKEVKKEEVSRKEINGLVFVTYDDGSFEYINEHNPRLKELQK